MFVWSSTAEPHPIAGGAPPRPAASVRWGFTSRAPEVGESVGDFAGLNLGGHVGDDPSAVEVNRSRVAAEFAVARDRLLFMNQVHGTDVAVVDGPWEGEAADCDAIVTTTPGLAVAVLVADCTPILLADPEAGVIGAAHAGRPGLAGGVVDAVVTAMRDVGARSLQAAVGPSICGRCYEVPEAMRDEVAGRHPVSACASWSGTPALDVAAGVVERLRLLDVSLTCWVPGCTRESESLYSYRRAGRTGRFAGVIGMGER